MQLAIVVIVAGLIVGAAVAVPLTVLNRSSGSTSTPGSGASGAQAQTLYRQALALMRSASGFHYDASVNGGGGQHTVGDAGQSAGRQDITLNSAFGSERFTLLLVDGTVYFQGNVPAFEDQLGVPAAKAASLQGTWISVSHSDGPYASLAAGITAADQAGETALQPASVSSTTVSGAVKALRIEGAVPPQQGAPAGTGHLDIDASSHRPLAYVESLSQGGIAISSKVTFSAWGTAPSVNAPAGPTAWSSLGASPPPGGYGNGGAPAGSPPTPPGTI